MAGKARMDDQDGAVRSFWRTHGLLGVITAVLALLGTLLVAVIGSIVASDSPDDQTAEPPPTTESVTSPGTKPSSPAPTTELPRSTSPEPPTTRPSTRPALTASPASGGPNTNIAVEGTSFRYPGGYVIRVDWGPGIGSRSAAAIPQSNGEIRVEFTVPDGTPPGLYHVRVFEMTNVLASATFTVTG